MQFYSNKIRENMDKESIVTVPPVFNSNSMLQFNINKTGGHLQLMDSRIRFSVDLPKHTVPGKSIYYTRVIKTPFVLTVTNSSFLQGSSLLDAFFICS